VRAARRLVAREPLAAPRLERLRAELHAGTWLDDRPQRLAPALVGHPEDGGVDDGGMRDERGLDLRGIDVDAPRDHHVGAPVSDVEVAALVEPAHVADGEEVAAERRRRLLRRVVIGELPATERRQVDGADLARRQLATGVVEDLHRDAGPRTADAAGPLEPLRRTDDRARALGRS